MREEAQPELSIGLSEEERNELEHLITVMRDDKPACSTEPSPHTLEQHLETAKEQVSHCSEIILNFDSRMKSLYETVCLLYEKSSKMNERINSIASTIAAKIL
jgi:hypothetical protein